MSLIDLVYFNAGGGHRAAALALRAVLAQRQPAWQVRLVNLTEVLDGRGRFRKVAGFEPEDLYNMRLARGWTMGLSQELRLLQAAIRLSHGAMVRTLRRHWQVTAPDLVVSLIPNFNRTLYCSLPEGVPFVTVMTDLADLPPHFWIEPDQDQLVVCGSPHALSQARAMGCRDQNLRLTSGMILRPDFYHRPTVDRADGLRAMGLDPDRPVGVVMFGGQGSARMLGIARQLRGEVQLVLLCGHNKALAEALRRDPACRAHAVFGFTPDVPNYLHCADFFIGKPGPGCLSEAVHCGLPVVTLLNRWTMPQERYNAPWIVDNGSGLAAASIDDIATIVRQKLLPSLRVFQARTATHRNRGVFEVADILAARMAESDLPLRRPRRVDADTLRLATL